MEETRFNEICQLRQFYLDDKITWEEYKAQVSDDEDIEWSLESGKRLAEKGRCFDNI